MRKSKKETIDRIVLVLKEMQSEISRGSFNSQISVDMCRKHKILASLLTTATKAGIFTKVHRNKYQCNIGIIEPFHARKILEKRKQYYLKRKKNQSDKSSKPTIVVKRAYVKKAAPAIKEKGNLLFRLIKFIFGSKN